MPRTVEHIVACHQAAAALRASGKPVWSKQIDIKSIIREDQANATPEHIAAIFVRIAELLRSRVPASVFDFGHDEYDSGLAEAVEEMEGCTVASLAVDAENGADALEMFNGWLEAIYDWADASRVWLGN